MPYLPPDMLVPVDWCPGMVVGSSFCGLRFLVTIIFFAHSLGDNYLTDNYFLVAAKKEEISHPLGYFNYLECRFVNSQVVNTLYCTVLTVIKAVSPAVSKRGTLYR